MSSKLYCTLKDMVRKRIRYILGYVWLFALGVALLLSAQNAYRQAGQVEEYATGCDPFGYLVMAQEIRAAVAQHRQPDFHIKTPHTDDLIEFFKVQGDPLSAWGEIVAPHAHHYFPPVDAVGVQYPPGTGLMLALFPEGRAVHGLSRFVVLVFTVLGLGLLAAAAAWRAWWSAGLVVLALHFGLATLARLGIASFSFNALLLPLALAVLLSCVATGGLFGKKAQRGLVVCATVSGLLFGLTFLIRLPVLFLLPGFLLLYLPPFSRDAIQRGAAFVAGLCVSGVAPLLWYQQRMVGAWYLSTYSAIDNAPPGWEFWTSNREFYFGGGPGSLDNWGLYAAVPGVIGGIFLLGARGGLSRWRLPGAALVMWLLPTAYFLTHSIRAQYYLAPSLCGTVLLLAFGLFVGELRRVPDKAVASPAHKILRVVLILLALSPGLVVWQQVWTQRTAAMTEKAPRELVVPEDLRDERAWIWSDELAGSFWYYARRPAYKIAFTSAEVRARLLRFVYLRGEPQYLVLDGISMNGILDEVRALGGQLQPRGTVGGFTYYQINWPRGGPQ